MYGLNLDDIMEDLFFEMERVQDGTSGHRIVIDEAHIYDAAALLAGRLSPFFQERMYECDNHGSPKE
jgi:hypothetical protein